MSDDSDQGASSTKPYLLRALYEWCCDNGLTPYLAVKVDAGVRVPREHVRNGEIVLNISFGATNGLNMGNDEIRFKARFGGVARDIAVPVSHVTAIYARENGQGMAFPPPSADAAAAEAPRPVASGEPVDEPADEAPDAPAAVPATAPAGPRLHAVPSSPAESAPAPAASSPSEPDVGGDGDGDGDGDNPPEPPPPRPSGPHLKRVK